MLVIEATRRLVFEITAANVSKAVRYEKGKCVVALALKDRKDIADVLIGASVSTVTFTSGKIVRYRTPAILRDALNRWDRTGEWGLPVGKYYLEIPVKRIAVAAKKSPAKVVRFYSTGRKRVPARNPRHIHFLRRKRAA